MFGDFYKTPLGRRFFSVYVPQIAKHLGRIADELDMRNKLDSGEYREHIDKLLRMELEGPQGLKTPDPDMVELDGPYECSNCGGHMSLDVSFIAQVDQSMTCPYCETLLKIPEAEESG